jgi:hypothetical protein
VIGVSDEIAENGPKTLALTLTMTAPSDFPDSTMSLFSPDEPHNTSRLFRFLHEVNEKHELRLETYQDLYQWSISNLDLFWSQVWDHTEIIGNKGNHIVDTTATPAQNPTWFSDSTLNYAENLLSNRSPDLTAIVQVGTLFIFLSHQRLGNELRACSRTNFPESQARPCPNIQRTSLLTRRGRSFRPLASRARPG